MAEPNASWLNKEPSSPWELVKSPARQHRQKDALHQGSQRRRNGASVAARILLVSKSLPGTAPHRKGTDAKETTTRTSPYNIRSRLNDDVLATVDNDSPHSSRTPKRGKNKDAKPSQAEGSAQPKPCNVARAEPSPTRFEVHALYTGVVASNLRLKGILDKRRRVSQRRSPHQREQFTGSAVGASPSGAGQASESAGDEPSQRLPHTRSQSQSQRGNGEARSQLALLARALVDLDEAGACGSGSLSLLPGSGVKRDLGGGPGSGGRAARRAAAASAAGGSLSGALTDVRSAADAGDGADDADDADVTVAELDACLAAGAATIQVLAGPEPGPVAACAGPNAAATRGALGTASIAIDAAVIASPSARGGGAVACTSQLITLRCKAPEELCQAVQSVQKRARKAPLASPGARQGDGVAAATEAAMGMTPTAAGGTGSPATASIRMQLPEPSPVKALQATSAGIPTDAGAGGVGVGAVASGSLTPADGKEAGQGDTGAGRHPPAPATAAAATTKRITAIARPPAGQAAGPRIRRVRSVSRLNPEHPGNGIESGVVEAEPTSYAPQLLKGRLAGAAAVASTGGTSVGTARGGGEGEGGDGLLRRPPLAEGSSRAAERPVTPCVERGSYGSPNLATAAATAANGAVRPVAAGADGDLPRCRIQLDADDSPEAGPSGPGGSITPAAAFAGDGDAAVEVDVPARTAPGPPSTCPSSDQLLPIAQLAARAATSTKAPSPSASAGVVPNRPLSVAAEAGANAAAGAGATSAASGAAALVEREERATSVVAVQLSTGEEDNGTASPARKEIQQQQGQASLLDPPSGADVQTHFAQSSLAEAPHRRSAKPGRRRRQLRGKRLGSYASAATRLVGGVGAEDFAPGKGLQAGASGASAPAAAPTAADPVAAIGNDVALTASVTPTVGLKCSGVTPAEDGGDESSPDLPIAKLAAAAAMASRGNQPKTACAKMPSPPRQPQPSKAGVATGATVSAAPQRAAAAALAPAAEPKEPPSIRAVVSPLPRLVGAPVVPDSMDVPIGMLAAAAATVTVAKTDFPGPSSPAAAASAVVAADGPQSRHQGKDGDALSVLPTVAARPTGLQGPPAGVNAATEAAADLAAVAAAVEGEGGCAPSRMKKRRWRSHSSSSAPSVPGEREEGVTGGQMPPGGDGAVGIPTGDQAAAQSENACTALCAGASVAVTQVQAGSEGAVVPWVPAQEALCGSCSLDEAPPSSLATVACVAAAGPAPTATLGGDAASNAQSTLRPQANSKVDSQAAGTGTGLATEAPVAASGVTTAGTVAGTAAGRVQLSALWKRQRLNAVPSSSLSGPRSVAGRLRAHGTTAAAPQEEQQHEQRREQQAGQQPHSECPQQLQQEPVAGQEEDLQQLLLQQQPEAKDTNPDSRVPVPDGAAGSMGLEALEALTASAGLLKHDGKRQQQQSKEETSQAEDAMQVGAPGEKRNLGQPCDAGIRDPHAIGLGAADCAAANEDVMDVDDAPRDQQRAQPDQQQGQQQQQGQACGEQSQQSAKGPSGLAGLSTGEPVPSEAALEPASSQQQQQQPARVQFRSIWKRQKVLEPPPVVLQGRSRGLSAFTRTGANSAVVAATATTAAVPPVAERHREPLSQMVVTEAGTGTASSGAVDGMDCSAVTLAVVAGPPADVRDVREEAPAAAQAAVSTGLAALARHGPRHPPEEDAGAVSPAAYLAPKGWVAASVAAAAPQPSCRSDRLSPCAALGPFRSGSAADGGGLHRTPPRPSPACRPPGIGPVALASTGAASAGALFPKPPRSPCDLRMPLASPLTRMGTGPSPSPSSRGPPSSGHRFRDPSLHPAAVSSGGAAALSPLAAQQPPPQRLFQQLQAAAALSPLRETATKPAALGASSPKPPLAAVPAVSSALALLGAGCTAGGGGLRAAAATGDAGASTCTAAFLQPLAPIRTKLEAGASPANGGGGAAAAGVRQSIVRDVEALLSIPLMAGDDDDNESGRDEHVKGCSIVGWKVVAGTAAEAANMATGCGYAPAAPPQQQKQRSPLDHLLEAAATGSAGATATCTAITAAADGALLGSSLSPLAMLVNVAASEGQRRGGDQSSSSGGGGREGAALGFDGSEQQQQNPPPHTGASAAAGDGCCDPPPSDGPKPLRSALRGVQPFFSAPSAWGSAPSAAGTAAAAPSSNAPGLTGGVSPSAAGSASGARTSVGPSAWFHARGGGGGHGSHSGVFSLNCDERLDGGKTSSPLPPRPRRAGKPPVASPLGGLGFRLSPSKSPTRGQADSPVASLRPLDGYSTPPPSHASGKGRQSPAGWHRTTSYPGRQYDSMIEDVVQQILNEASPEPLPLLELGPAVPCAAATGATQGPADAARGADVTTMAVDISDATNAARPALGTAVGEAAAAAAGDAGASLQESAAPLHPSSPSQQEAMEQQSRGAHPPASPTRRRSIYLPSPMGKRRRSVDDVDEAGAIAVAEANGSSASAGGEDPSAFAAQVQDQPQHPLGHRRRPRKAARVDGGGGMAAAVAAAAAAAAAAASDRMDLDELSNLGSEDSGSEDDAMDRAGGGGGGAAARTGARSGVRGGGRGMGAFGSLFAGRGPSQGPGGHWMKPGLAWGRSAGAAPGGPGPARASPQLRSFGAARPSPSGAVSASHHPPTRPALAASPITATAATAAVTRLGAPQVGGDPGSPGDSLLDVQRVTSYHQKPGSRRGSSYLAVSLEAANARPTLEQEYREALINARLAQAWAAGERWARCDLAGLPLDLSRRGVTERFAMLDAAASKLNCYRGTEGASKIMAKVEEEWEHLKSIRIAAAARTTVRTPSGVTPSPASASARRGGPPATPMPFAALAQAASLSRPLAAASQPTANIAARAVGVAAASEVAAAPVEFTAGRQGEDLAGVGLSAGAGAKPAVAAALGVRHGLAEMVSAHGHAYCHRGSPPPPSAAPPRLHAAHPHPHPQPHHLPHPHPHPQLHPPLIKSRSQQQRDGHHQHVGGGSAVSQQHPLPGPPQSDPNLRQLAATEGLAPSAAVNGGAVKEHEAAVAGASPPAGCSTSSGRGAVARQGDDATPQLQSGPQAGADPFGTPSSRSAGATAGARGTPALHQLTPPASILRTVVPTPIVTLAGLGGSGRVGHGAWAAATPGCSTTEARKAVKFAAVLELGPQAGYRHASQPLLAVPPLAFDLPSSQTNSQSQHDQPQQQPQAAEHARL